mmetsp:Transcript_18096/g.37123  ORF Transcript_18096/g.37123 Transcript_18096/m.37123 type:complete len:85 (-) Transcript_18096:59-313(-)
MLIGLVLLLVLPCPFLGFLVASPFCRVAVTANKAQTARSKCGCCAVYAADHTSMIHQRTQEEFVSFHFSEELLPVPFDSCVHRK